MTQFSLPILDDPSIDYYHCLHPFSGPPGPPGAKGQRGVRGQMGFLGYDGSNSVRYMSFGA